MNFHLVINRNIASHTVYAIKPAVLVNSNKLILHLSLFLFSHSEYAFIFFKGQIKVLNALEFDHQPTYTVPVIVEGHGISTTEVLTINIIDTNDPHSISNLPEFIQISAATVKARDTVCAAMNNHIKIQTYFTELITERQREQTERQTDRQRQRQTDRQTDIKTGR